MQDRLISRALQDSGKPARLPAPLRFLLGFRAVRHIPARLFGSKATGALSSNTRPKSPGATPSPPSSGGTSA